MEYAQMAKYYWICAANFNTLFCSFHLRQSDPRSFGSLCHYCTVWLGYHIHLVTKVQIWKSITIQVTFHFQKSRCHEMWFFLVTLLLVWNEPLCICGKCLLKTAWYVKDIKWYHGMSILLHIIMKHNHQIVICQFTNS